MSQTLSVSGIRQHYMDAIGLDVWLPTQPLVGAAPSPEWVWGELSDSRLESTIVEPKVEATAAGNSVEQPARVALIHRPAPVAKSLEVMPETKDSVAQTSPATEELKARPAAAVEPSEPASTASQTTYAAPPRFRLAMVVYDDALVISQLPMDVLQPLVPEHQALLHRILQSIGLGIGSSKTQLFAWPIVNNPNVDQSAELAQAAVKSLASRLNADALPLLIFGHQLVEYLGLPEQVVTEWTHVDNRLAIAGPTLNELISIPGFKRDLWVRLQSFQTIS